MHTKKQSKTAPREISDRRVVSDELA